MLYSVLQARLFTIALLTNAAFAALGVAPVATADGWPSTWEPFATGGDRSVGVTLYQQAYVKASNPGIADLFGTSVAISGNTMVIGAPGESSTPGGGQGDDSINSAGAAYVYVREGSTWRFEAFLKGSRNQLGGKFGESVAIDGGLIVVGAPGVGGDLPGGDSTGVVDIFARQATGWTRIGTLQAGDGERMDGFGTSVAVSGVNIAVGAPFQDGVDNSAPNAGAVYLFAAGLSLGPLRAAGTEAGDFFGTTVAFAGEFLVVGAPGDDGGTGGAGDQATGAVHVFGTLGKPEIATLKASNADPGDQLGATLAASEGLIVAGSFHEASGARGVDGDQDDNSTDRAGAAYVFGLQDGAWIQEAYLKASNTSRFGQFASSLAAGRDTVVVGARGADTLTPFGGALNSGAGYLFQRTTQGWGQTAFFRASNAEQHDAFGASLALSGDTLVFGAPEEDSYSKLINGDQNADFPEGRRSGAVYVHAGLFNR